MLKSSFLTQTTLLFSRTHSTKMKHLLVIVLSLLFAPLLHAVGNIVIKDVGELTDKGFVFDVTNDHFSDKVIHISFKIPEKYHFGEVMGIKSFQGGSFYEPIDQSAREARLIGAVGTRLALLVEKSGKKFSGSLSLIKADTKNKYLEFQFNQSSGYPPMLIHVPLELLVDLQKPAK